MEKKEIPSFYTNKWLFCIYNTCNGKPYSELRKPVRYVILAQFIILKLYMPTTYLQETFGFGRICRKQRTYYNINTYVPTYS